MSNFFLKRTRYTLALAGAIYLAAPIVGCSQQPTTDLPDRSVFMTRRMPYREIDQLPQHTIEVGAAKIHVAFAPGELDLPQEVVIDWAKRCADVIAKYYGRFPVNDARILVIPVNGDGVRNGTTYGYHGAATKLYLGNAATLAQLDDDWVLIHEMVHYAFPGTGDAHNWISEGQATYVENIARTQAGVRDTHEAWKEIVLNMPKGLPGAGDEGLDHTHTWARTYWGGALFCLL
ncbi:MAG TPA: hypothetical protein VET48_01605, partial [Steroidobacteraceae bacterium]|nr:hypothetical protein [Steroidobacteraceae bacterium]